LKKRVAVIDVGSNSIKALVAEAASPLPLLKVCFERTLEVRISKGIAGNPPRLSEAGISAGCAAVDLLARACREHGPLMATRLVATSAVRSAVNGHLFPEAVRKATGLEVSILTGGEEADAIGAGVLTDPRIGNSMTDFSVFDLGGGSLELIRFGSNGVLQRTSLPLGAVRLTEALVGDPARPLPPEIRNRISAHVRDAVGESGVHPGQPLVGCSGGLAALRGILEADGRRDAENGLLKRASIARVMENICRLTIAERKRVPGMPPERADIFPAALVTILTLMDMAAADSLLHSYHNLRYGLALRLLEADSSS